MRVASKSRGDTRGGGAVGVDEASSDAFSFVTNAPFAGLFGRPDLFKLWGLAGRKAGGGVTAEATVAAAATVVSAAGSKAA